ncbi:MAG: T9SS type A sorting domain-containing protein [candidate division Zixibacteria bacterium]|nr:T9SS type A sorting domain-containing protein [candidate division Zixibacteria bacterium]
MRKALLVVSLIAIVLLFGSSVVLAADVALGVQKPAFIEPNSQSILQISLTNDEVLNGLQIPLSFFHNTNNDIRCDSIQWTSRVTSSNPTMYAGQAGDMSYLHNDNKTMAVVLWAVWYDKGLPPGKGQICNLYLSTGPNWDSKVGLPIDITDKLDPPGLAEVSDKEGQALPLAFKVNEGGNSGDVGGTTLPTEFKLHQNYPNPFNPATTIEFDLAKDGPVGLVIYNIMGQKVKAFQQNYSRGTVKVVWDGTDQSGNPVASGTYFYRVSADGKTLVSKMLLLK